MTLWLINILLTLVVLAFLLRPLFRQSATTPPRADYDIVVYRAQLAEMEKERRDGLLSDGQAAALRTEVHRRMLAAEDAESCPVIPDERRLLRRPRWGVILALLLVLPSAALLLYGVLGTPGLPAQPMAERREDPSFAQAGEAEAMAARLRREPSAEGFARLAKLYTSLHRYDAAAAAYRSAIAQGQADGETWSRLGESLTLDQDGTVTAEAAQAFSRALSVEPSDPQARFYLGLAKAQAGDLRGAVAIWRDLEQDGPEDVSWMPMLREHIATYARQGGFEPAAVAPARPQPQTGEDGAPGTATAEQQQFIRTMVAGLATRLESSPDDLEGWLRLGRAYRVLGESDKAKQALRRAVALRPDDVSVKLSLAEVLLDEVREGPLTAEFVGTMREVLALDADNVDALYFVGEAEHQAGHADQARRLWQKALAQLAADSPERAGIQRQLESLGP